jgi:hypothetical protein
MRRSADDKLPPPVLAVRKRAPMIRDDVLRFVRGSIKSVWMLDLLLLMRRGGDRAWPIDELTRELRGNRTLVLDLLSGLGKAGLVETDEAGNYRYRPANEETDALVGELERIYMERPLTLIREIVSAPNEKIQSFADAFKLKKD